MSDPQDLETCEFRARLRRREERAVRQVVRAYLPRIVRAAEAAGLPAEDVDEVVRRTFVGFIEALPRSAGRGRLRRRLFSILHRELAIWAEAGTPRGICAGPRLRLHLAIWQPSPRHGRQLRAVGRALHRAMSPEPDPERCQRLEDCVFARCAGLD